VTDLLSRAECPSNEDLSGADGVPKIWIVGALVRTSTASAQPTRRKGQATSNVRID
jgi:hypothetical protein